MRYFLLTVITFILLIVFTSKIQASYDPLLYLNNKFGIHILFPSELSEAAHLVNSTGGDWGYVAIPIQANDKNLDKWQSFMNDCAKHHLIPIVRIATVGDYFATGSWSKPDKYDVIDFANFLNDLSWPTKNRYVVIFNEPNRGDEWGGIPDATEYANILDYAVDVFKKRHEDFFIISAGLDNAAANIEGQSISNYSYIYNMNNANPLVFSKIDGISSHSYPNPGFSKPPSKARMGIYTYFYEKQAIESYANKKLPVFITETGWSTDKIPDSTQAQYYLDTFANYWNDPSIIAVTPFILNAGQGPFAQFSFVNNGVKSNIYNTLFNMQKNIGEPLLNPVFKKTTINKTNLPTENFKKSTLLNIFNKIGTEQKTFLKWILGI